jgi:hypothetical protein
MSRDKLSQLPAMKASLEEIRAAQARVSLADPEHLRRWLEESRPFLIFSAQDLSDSLSPLWPDGAKWVQQMVACYRAHRATIPSGEIRVSEMDGEKYEQPLFKGDSLTLAEKDRAVRWLVSQILEEKPDWSLEAPGL